MRSPQPFAVRNRLALAALCASSSVNLWHGRFGGTLMAGAFYKRSHPGRTYQLQSIPLLESLGKGRSCFAYETLKFSTTCHYVHFAKGRRKMVCLLDTCYRPSTVYTRSQMASKGNSLTWAGRRVYRIQPFEPSTKPGTPISSETI